MPEVIIIEGKVTRAPVGTAPPQPVPGVKVIASREGTEVQQVTDPDGKYSLVLGPGQWRIAVRGDGFKEHQAYLASLVAGTPVPSFDFQLQEGYAISGLVIQQGSNQPAEGVYVVAWGDTGKIGGRAVTDKTGRYTILDLPGGTWKVRGTRVDSKTNEESQTNEAVRQVPGENEDVNLTLAHAMDKDDWKWGRIFFASLGALLVVLAAVYLVLHAFYPAAQDPGVQAIVNQVDQALNIVQGQAQPPAAATTTPPADTLAKLSDAVKALQTTWTGLSPALKTVIPRQVGQVNLLLAQAETAIGAKNVDDVKLALTTIRSTLGGSRTAYFWSDPPGSYVEVVFWSLAGILVSLLVTSGWYLRRNTFYREGIWMHLSHLLVVPLLALVLVFLISQLKLAITVGDSTLTLDITDPRLLAALSFIIAARPWGMVRLVRDTSEQIFGSLRRVAPAGEKPAKPSTPGTGAQPAAQPK